MMKYLNIILLQFLFALSVSAQCFDADASIWENTWVSCETSQNPKSEYGNTHWIMYNFGEARNLSKTWVWNTNEPGKLNQGFNLVKIDYSLDGTEWTYWGEMNFAEGSGQAVYGGFPGPDMVGISAQYVLVTSITNHGHSSCAGIAEIKFNLLPQLEYGNPNGGGDGEECVAVEDIYYEIEGTEVFIEWEVESEFEMEFLVAYRLQGTEEWQIVEVGEEREAFIEGLEEDKTYEFVIVTVCEEEELTSEIQTFTTSGEGGCHEVEELWVEEVEETNVLIEWEEVFGIDAYIVQFGPTNSQDREIVSVFEPYIWLEDLLPLTEYEVLIGLDCEEELLWSQSINFMTEGTISDLVIGQADVHPFSAPSIFPNPTKQDVTLRFQSQVSSTLEYRLLNAQGQSIINKQVQLNQGINTFQIDLSNLPTGIYLLNTNEIGSAQGFSQKIIKI